MNYYVSNPIFFALLRYCSILTNLKEKHEMLMNKIEFGERKNNFWKKINLKKNNEFLEYFFEFEVLKTVWSKA